MSNYFLASLGSVEAFRRNDDGSMQLAFVAKTLTESTVNISTSKEDIRAGQGAPIVFSFFHSANAEINITDVLWKPAYLEAQLGTRFSSAEHEDYKTREVTFTNGTATLDEDVHEMPFPCNGANKYLAWGAKAGTDEWKDITVGDDHRTLTLAGASGKYCVRYLGVEAAAKAAEITASIIPSELFLIIKTPIYAGDGCSKSNGKPVGHLTFEVPRFLLNGSQNFAMNMNAHQPLSLAGTAMSSVSADCDSEAGKLVRIIEVIVDRKWTDDAVGLIIDEESKEAGDHPSVYAEMKDGHLYKAADSELEIKEGTGDYHDLAADFTFSNGVNYTIRLKDTDLTVEADIPAVH